MEGVVSLTLIKKMFFYVGTEGTEKTMIRAVNWMGKKVKRLPARCKEQFFRNRYAKQIAVHVEGKELYLLTYSFDWNTPLFQRPHQLAVALSQCENAHVIFVSDQYQFDNFAGFITINAHLDVVPLRFLLKNPNILQCAEHITIFKSLPLQPELLKVIRYDKLVYDYIDDLSLLPYCTEEMRTFHYKLIETADLTVCTAKTLYDDAIVYTERAILSPNACDYDFFHGSRNCEPDESAARQIEGYDCVLGYYGCFAQWFDYELVIQIAVKRPNWCFFLIGQCFDRSDQCLRETELHNIILWPAQPYKDLPRFIAAFDIQIIPFKISQITKGTSPVKIFEYMAAGKPILTSAIPECMQYRSVEVYHTAEEFIEKAETLLTLPQDSEYFKQMNLDAEKNTWENRVEEILEHIKEGRTADGG